MMSTLYLVYRDPGSAWVDRAPTRSQPSWSEHGAFMDRLFEQRRIVLAGPFAEGRGRALIVVDASSAAEAASLFRDDPWTTQDILGVGEIVEWTIFLDARKTAD